MCVHAVRGQDEVTNENRIIRFFFKQCGSLCSPHSTPVGSPVENSENVYDSEGTLEKCNDSNAMGREAIRHSAWDCPSAVTPH